MNLRVFQPLEELNEDAVLIVYEAEWRAREIEIESIVETDYEEWLQYTSNLQSDYTWYCENGWVEDALALRAEHPWIDFEN